MESKYKILTMFVSDKIKLNYHPVVNDLKILDKYYPLYIKISDKKFPKRNFEEYKFTKGKYRF